ncbi:MAG TPA: AbrB/MazE/SpoVT family DNA-binding domain-containing protein [Candidatus Ventrousia excrementavium]|uniref:AbrB/MazE/SpoVT family DNA-binding domain-containing protein n=1 Tax=Candidatus Ventrousia excrementavium TaxID=2840961 RepID=A0A9D1S194_9CLOT|nr:AbrB/MazE/SpoVT family DNA-binding domain-containing protein [Candidatus Ventrousia excrementavium]
MKSTGIVRKIDELGRIVLPIEMRHTMHIEPRDSMEIFVDGNSIILRKYEQECIFCGSTKKVSVFKDRCVCENCRKELSL